MKSFCCVSQVNIYQGLKFFPEEESYLKSLQTQPSEDSFLCFPMHFPFNNFKFELILYSAEPDIELPH